MRYTTYWPFALSQTASELLHRPEVIHNTWRPVPGRIKDFIFLPRPNGYQSLHTSVAGRTTFRVKIRTTRCIASRKKESPPTGP